MNKPTKLQAIARDPSTPYWAMVVVAQMRDPVGMLNTLEVLVEAYKEQLGEPPRATEVTLDCGLCRVHLEDRNNTHGGKPHVHASAECKQHSDTPSGPAPFGSARRLMS